MSDSFKVGDIAVYIGPRRGTGTSGLQKGSMHRVISVVMHPFEQVDGLKIAARPRPVYAESFKKLPPATDEFTRQIRACCPNKSRQPV